MEEPRSWQSSLAEEIKAQTPSQSCSETLLGTGAEEAEKRGQRDPRDKRPAGVRGEWEQA